MENKSKRLTDQVAGKIGLDIIAGRLAAGALLPNDAELGALYGVSRVVLREALRMLGAKGLVHAVPKAGTFVCPRQNWAMFDPLILEWLTRETPPEKRRVFLHELLDLRLMFEPGAAALAASRASPEARQNISDQFARLRQTGIGLDTGAAELQYFSLVLESAGNDFLAPLRHINQTAHTLIEKIGHRYTRDFDPRPHERLTRAILNHDAAASRASMQALLLSLYVRS